MATGTPPPLPRLVPFTVGEWLVEPKACRLSRGDTGAKLRPQLVDVLACLARRAGHIVLKDEILAEVWPGQFIAESGLSRCIAELRQLLHDDAQQPLIIETIPKRGYRLIAPVVWLREDALPAVGPSAEGLTEATLPETGATEPDHAPALPGAPAALVHGPRRRVFAWVAAAVAVGVVGAIFVLMSPRSRAFVLNEQDSVLLAFENRTGDRVFDDTIPLAMSIQMEQSPYLRLVSPGQIQETLRMMKRPGETPVTRAVGMEVCERLGGRAVIVTTIAPLGQQYAVGVEAAACGSGRVVSRQQVIANKKESVLEGLQRAAVEIRRAVGEPATSLERYTVPIVEGTTPSLEALRALRLGDAARERGQLEVALGLYRQAVSLDPDFALAHSRLGTVLQTVGTEAESAAAFEKAYALRERVTFPERLEIEAAYHRVMTGEQAKIVEALELLKRTYPRRAFYRRSLAAEHVKTGRYDLALTEALEAQRLEPSNAMAAAAAALAYLHSNRIAEARATAEKGIALGGVAPLLHLTLFQCGLATGDAPLLARERAWAQEHADIAALYFLESEAEEALNRGRLQAALGFLRQFETVTRTTGSPETAAMLRLRMARFEALAGLRTDALRHVREELRRGLPPRLTIDAVKVTVSAGEFDLTARLLDEIEARRGPGGAQPEATLIVAYRAALEASRGRTDAALARLAPLETFELGFAYGFIPLYERAQAHFLAGDWAKARAAFEKMLAHPTIDSGRKLLPSAEVGLARTFARAGDIAASRRTYEQLFERWREADPDLPVLLQARREYAALPK